MKNVRSAQEERKLRDAVGCKKFGKKFRFPPDSFLMVSAIFMMMNCIPSCIPNLAEALPFPAPNLQNCRSSEGCCTPALSNSSSRKFEFPGITELQLRVRPAAHLLDDAYIAKYQKATELMRALPDTDGRSFLNQYKLHCAYCDNNLYFKEGENGDRSSYPLEIHRSWLFFPWHRYYLYFYERILATLLDDDTFALPFWNWDNQQSPGVPRVYSETRSLWENAINQTSSLYDPDRTDCAKRTGAFVEFQNTSACPPEDRDEKEVRATNAHLMYMNMVGVGSTPRLFQGAAYRYGDEGGGGEGCLEAIPHGSIHGWVNEHDMEGFKDSASDPIFFAHHANLDRLWALWKTLPGGIREDIDDPDYLDTQFTFYDERGGIVTVSVKQALQLEQLRYTYEEVPNPWLHHGAVRDHSKPPNRNICNPNNSPSDLATLIKTTKPFKAPVNFTKGPHTFKLPRHPTNRSTSSLEEILELRGDVDFLAFAKGDVLAVTAFAFHPEAQVDESMGCAEYLGVRWLFSHVGISEDYPPQDVWRTGIRHQMELMGTEHLEYLVVTLVGSSDSVNSIRFTSARIVYSKE